MFLISQEMTAYISVLFNEIFIQILLQNFVQHNDGNFLREKIMIKKNF